MRRHRGGSDDKAARGETGPAPGNHGLCCRRPPCLLRLSSAGTAPTSLVTSTPVSEWEVRPHRRRVGHKRHLSRSASYSGLQTAGSPPGSWSDSSISFVRQGLRARWKTMGWPSTALCMWCSASYPTSRVAHSLRSAMLLGCCVRIERASGRVHVYACIMHCYHGVGYDHRVMAWQSPVVTSISSVKMLSDTASGASTLKGHQRLMRLCCIGKRRVHHCLNAWITWAPGVWRCLSPMRCAGSWRALGPSGVPSPPRPGWCF